ncbi:MAG: hypothetical protein NC338_03020 [Firmicutes bacterium]|nr:hypothetical protein [Bacillota bacterium]MCM1401248.1 hypothetical protein [Bacteroides sp.]MCM1477203.1 hypothetical protein [Bacteroides sp.]
MSFFKNIKKFLAPENIEPAQNDVREEIEGIGQDEITVKEVLDSIKHHFNLTIKKLSTEYNFLYHTSFTIYLKASNYTEISDSLPFLAEGAEKMLVDIIKKHTSKAFPNYQPHSQYWQFQLVEIPEDAVLDGVTPEQLLTGALVQISSSLYPPTEGGSQPQGDSRVVTTVQGVNSLRAIRNCINPNILNKLDLVEKDRIRLLLQLDEHKAQTGFAHGVEPSVSAKNASERKGTTAKKAAPSQQGTNTPPRQSTYFATLEAQEGEFLEGAGDKKIHIVAMTSEQLNIVGRSSMRGAPGVDVVRVNSDRVMTPHAMIRRNASTGRFEIAIIGPATLNERSIAPNPDQWRPLPNNSTIILADSVQIRFRSNI